MMKKLAAVVMCSLALVACSKGEDPKVVDNAAAMNTDTSSSAATATSAASTPEVQIGNKFVVLNELQNKNIKIEAFETNLNRDGKFYYQLNIENTAAQPLHIKTEQIVLVDSAGNEHPAGLIDRVLNEPFEAKQAKTGIVAFDDLGVSTPKLLKFKQ